MQRNHGIIVFPKLSSILQNGNINICLKYTQQILVEGNIGIFIFKMEFNFNIKLIVIFFILSV